jgi:hypothetical protein
MSNWVLILGALLGLGVFLLVSELLPAGAPVGAALARLGEQEASPAGPPPAALSHRMGRGLAEALPWLPVPAADLTLLNQDRAAWLASKVACGLLGLAAPVLVTALLALGGHPVSWPVPVGAALLVGAGLFFAPDLVTHVNATEKRYDFRHALSSYLDLVGLERGAGAGPTEALEAAAQIGGGWAFQRIGAALDGAGHPGRRHRHHRAGRPGRHRGGGGPGRGPHPRHARGPGRVHARPAAVGRPGQGGLARHHHGRPHRPAGRGLPAAADLSHPVPHVPGPVAARDQSPAPR